MIKNLKIGHVGVLPRPLILSYKSYEDNKNLRLTLQSSL